MSDLPTRSIVVYVGTSETVAAVTDGLWRDDVGPPVQLVALSDLRAGSLAESAAWSTLRRASVVFVPWSPQAALALSTLSNRLQGLPVPLAVVGIDGDDERAAALSYGADRCFSRPVHPGLLDAAILAHARLVGLQARKAPRPEWLDADRFSVGRLHVDWADRAAYLDDRRLPLARQLYQALVFLAVRSGVREKDELVHAVWGEDAHPMPDTVHRLVSTLRKKLAAAGVPDAVETVRGVGYRLYPEAFERDAGAA